MTTQKPCFYRENSGTLAVVSNANFFATGDSNPPCFSRNNLTHAPFGISYICAKIDGDADSINPRASMALTPSISGSNTRIGSSLTYTRVESVQSNTTAIIPIKNMVSVSATILDSGDQVFASNFLFLHLACR